MDNVEYFTFTEGRIIFLCDDLSVEWNKVIYSCFSFQIETFPIY